MTKKHKEYKMIRTPKLNLGSDPEFFFKKKGKIVPSNEVIKEDSELVKRDGFQGELNPRVSGCREIAGVQVAIAVCEASRIAKKSGAIVSLQQTVDVDDETWERTPDDAKEFGCNPTKNSYKEVKDLPNGHDTRLRSAGGHIHMALQARTKLRHRTLVKVLDIMVGNSWVLIDRDKSNAVRRELYGRAGEYRIKKYGLEYRVPSNFWLRDYVLWSGITATCRNAIALVEAGYGRKLISFMDMDKVREAINTNNQELALENLNKLFEFLEKNSIDFEYGLTVRLHGKFLMWAKSKNPLKYFASTDEEVIKHHCSRIRRYRSGFETFLEKIK